GITCTPVDSGGCSGLHFTATAAPVLSDGSCSPMGPPQQATPPFSWSAEARLCNYRGDAAAVGPEGKVPTPATGVPFAPHYCVARKDQSECPPSYPAGRRYFQSQTDTRACDPCTCDAPTGVTCAGSVQIGATCNGPTSGPLPLACAMGDPKGGAIFVQASG